MPSPDRWRAAKWLLAKEWRGLRASRAWWLTVLATGPIVGVAFIGAVSTYTDISADAGCGIACSPLLGIWAPTFGAYQLVAILLLPFVAIRSLSGDRQSGAMALELQRPFSFAARIVIKTIALMAGWLITLGAGGISVALWVGYGGHVAGAELAVVVLGHVINALITIAFALAIAALTDHPSTAAVVALGITIGSWIVTFAAAVYGGIWQQLAALTPEAFVSTFQRGLLRVDAVLAVLVLVVTALAVAVVWTRPGVQVVQRATATVGLAVVAAGLVVLARLVPGSWDASETRLNSFSETAESAIASIAMPIRVEVHLAPQDARRAPFERGPLAKLRRTGRHVEVSYRARTSTGLYEQADAGYGEIRYAVGPRTGMSRALTDEAVVETVLDLANADRLDDTGSPYRGYPLSSQPRGALLVFLVLWPAASAGAWLWSSKSMRSSRRLS